MRASRSIAGAGGLVLAFVLFASTALAENYRYRPASDEHGHITVTGTSPGRRLHGGILIEEINGKLVPRQHRDIVSVPPGHHSIRFVGGAVLSRNNTRSERADEIDPNHDVLEIDVEAGKTYYVAWDSDEATIDSSVARGLVVHRIVDNKSRRTVWQRPTTQPEGLHDDR